MRRFYISKGMFKGEHILYDGDEEFRVYNPDVTLHIWYDENLEDKDIKENEFVRLNDGYITKILKIYKLGKNTWIYKICSGVLMSRKNKSGKLTRVPYYGAYAHSRRYRINGMRSTYKSLEKKIFGKYVAAGMNPKAAYKLAFRSNCRDNSILEQLIWSKTVWRTIMTEIKDFRIKMRTEITQEIAIKYIKEFIDNVEKGSKIHLESIKPMLELLGYIEEHKNKLNAIEIPYEEVELPKLE